MPGPLNVAACFKPGTFSKRCGSKSSVGLFKSFGGKIGRGDDYPPSLLWFISNRRGSEDFCKTSSQRQSQHRAKFAHLEPQQNSAMQGQVNRRSRNAQTSALFPACLRSGWVKDALDVCGISVDVPRRHCFAVFCSRSRLETPDPVGRVAVGLC